MPAPVAPLFLDCFFTKTLRYGLHSPAAKAYCPGATGVAGQFFEPAAKAATVICNTRFESTSFATTGIYHFAFIKNCFIYYFKNNQFRWLYYILKLYSQINMGDKIFK